MTKGRKRRASGDAAPEAIGEDVYVRGAPGTHPLDYAFQSNPDGVVERLGGDELTTRIVTHRPPEIGLRRFIEANRPGSFWNMLEDTLAECDETMKAHGWERTEEKPGRFPGDREAVAYSDLWYAGHIGVLCWMVLDWRDKGELPEVALKRILIIGRMAKEREWRVKYKAGIVRGDRVVKSSSKGGKARREALAEDRTARMAEMKRLRQEKPRLGVSGAAGTAFQRGLGPSADANRQLFYRWREKV